MCEISAPNWAVSSHCQSQCSHWILKPLVFCFPTTSICSHMSTKMVEPEWQFQDQHFNDIWYRYGTSQGYSDSGPKTLFMPKDGCWKGNLFHVIMFSCCHKNRVMDIDPSLHFCVQTNFRNTSWVQVIRSNTILKSGSVWSQTWQCQTLLIQSNTQKTTILEFIPET